MFCLYSKGCGYALRALVEVVARKTEGVKVTARDVCNKAGIPEAYTRKTFQVLVQKGFLNAVTGPGGGYELNRDPKTTTVLNLIEAVDGPDNYSGCVLGLSSCQEENPCSLHHVWKGVRDEMIQAFQQQTLQDLAGSLKPSIKKRRRVK